MDSDNFYSIKNQLSDIDKRFCKNTEEFVKNYKVKQDLMDNLQAKKIGRCTICDYIIERCNLLIRSNSLLIPYFGNEHDINRWFKENCNDLGLETFTHHRRHAKFSVIGSGEYSGIDYICKISDGFGFHSCENNYCSPSLTMYMDNNQRQMYNKFCDIVQADFLPIELEYLSGNFIKHKHPDIVSMVICYKKDKELSVPVLELRNPEANI